MCCSYGFHAEQRLRSLLANSCDKHQQYYNCSTVPVPEMLWAVLGQHRQRMLSEVRCSLGTSGGDIQSSDKSVDIPSALSAIAAANIQSHLESRCQCANWRFRTMGLASFADEVLLPYVFGCLWCYSLRVYSFRPQECSDCWACQCHH